MALALRFEQLIRAGTVRDYAQLARLGHVSPCSAFLRVLLRFRCYDDHRIVLRRLLEQPR